jgi:hypothetical protein
MAARCLEDTQIASLSVFIKTHTTPNQIMSRRFVAVALVALCVFAVAAEAKDKVRA